jgi:ABC-type glycerol-3-phosphate transport system substrate-binding protein
MKRTNRKYLFMRLCLLALVLLTGFASCKKSEGTKGSKEVTLRFLTWNIGDTEQKQVFPAWDAKTTGIKVEPQMIGVSDYFQTLKVQLASGEGPDMFALQTGATLEEFREFCLDIEPKAAQTWNSNWASKWSTSLMALTKGNLDKYYGLPLGSWYAGHIWANMEYFNKYNLKVPTTYDELLAVTKIFRANGEFPLLIGARDDWINLDMFINIAMDINGQKFFDAVEGKSPFTDPVIVQAFTIWKSLFDTGIFQDGALGINEYPDAMSIFQDERIAPLMCVGGWFVNQLDSVGSGMDLEVLTIDWNNDGKPAPVAPTVDAVMCINKNSKFIDETWQFYSWFVSDGIRNIIDHNVFFLPALVDHAVDGSKFPTEMQRALAKVQEIAKRAAFYREIPYPRLKQTLADQLKAVALGESTPRRAAEIVEAASKAERR